MGTTCGSRPVPPRWPLEVTDAVERGDLPGDRRRVRPGRERRPAQRRRVVAAVGVAGDPIVLGVQAELADAMTRSWRAGAPVDTDTAVTYADGIASRVAIPRAVDLMTGRVDAMVTVSEDDLHAAQDVLTHELGITVEGAAAASWAGLLAGDRPTGPVLVIVTGSNV